MWMWICGHCVGSENNVVVSCNEPSCTMKGGKTEFFKQDCATFSYFTQILIPILGHVTKCTCAMYFVCVAGVGIHWFSKILLWVLFCGFKVEVCFIMQGKYYKL